MRQINLLLKQGVDAMFVAKMTLLSVPASESRAGFLLSEFLKSIKENQNATRR